MPQQNWKKIQGTSISIDSQTQDPKEIYLELLKAAIQVAPVAGRPAQAVLLEEYANHMRQDLGLPPVKIAFGQVLIAELQDRAATAQSNGKVREADIWDSQAELLKREFSRSQP